MLISKGGYLMNVLIINGSPKGDYSVTLQTSNYLMIKYPNINFEVIHAGKYIKKYEKDFSSAVEKINNADLLIFSYPVYTFITPYQLHRFIELMKESKVDFSSKIATQISTSKHFYDVTAHEFVKQNCDDMQIKYIKGLSADMEDLTTEKGQKDAIKFFDYVLWSIENNYFEAPYKREDLTVVPTSKIQTPTKKSLNKNVIIVTDLKENDIQLKSMIERFIDILPAKCEIVNISEYPFQGGCLGCFACTSKGKCIYKDGFDEFLRTEIQSKDAIVYAFTIKDHSMGSRFKMYDDRQFCNGHRTVTMGTPVGYIINGNYSHEPNLKMIIDGKCQVGGNYLCGVADNEKNPDEQIDRLAKTITYAMENQLTQPSNFLGVGGMKIFRDLIYQMQGLMKADHKFFKEQGQYDFPQNKKGTIIAMYLISSLVNNKKLMNNKKVKAKIGSNVMNEGMLMPYKKVLEKEKQKK